MSPVDCGLSKSISRQFINIKLYVSSPPTNSQINDSEKNMFDGRNPAPPVKKGFSLSTGANFSQSLRSAGSHIQVGEVGDTLGRPWVPSFRRSLRQESTLNCFPISGYTKEKSGIVDE